MKYIFWTESAEPGLVVVVPHLQRYVVVIRGPGVEQLRKASVAPPLVIL
jgi:hypothetical protein